MSGTIRNDIPKASTTSNNNSSVGNTSSRKRKRNLPMEDDVGTDHENRVETGYDTTDPSPMDGVESTGIRSDTM